MPDQFGTIILIPARGGSKGLPRKNISPLAGKPLITWTIMAAMESGIASRIVVSTDDPEISSIASKFEVEVPFLRPVSLSSDTAGSVEVAEHALSWFAEKENWHPEWVIFLQPTSPLRSASDILNAFSLARDSGADAVISVTEPTVHPYLARAVTSEGKLTSLMPDAKISRRQDYPAVWMINGAIYIIRTRVLLSERTFQPENTLPFMMPRERSVDIDNLVDFRLAEVLLEHAND